MAESDGAAPVQAWRRVATAAVASTCQQAGYTSVAPAALSTLTECFVSLLKEMSRSTRAYADVACRANIVVGDVVLALVDAGFDITALTEYVRRRPRSTVATPQPTVPSKQPPHLQVGEKRLHPGHVPDYLPAFPDSHAYVQTPTHKQPITNYEAVREKAASQKRDMERALTRFIAKTGPVDRLFDTDEQAQFPLIACRPIISPYLQALDPRDQIFEEEEAYAPRKRAAAADDAEEEEISSRHAEPAPTIDTPDNPYLRPAKMPRKRMP